MQAKIDEGFVRQAAWELAEMGIDAWLLYDLEARNRVAAELLGLPEGQTRRYFVLLRPGHEPEALVHRIELADWRAWDRGLRDYVGWEEMEAELREMLSGCETVAMEVSTRDAVPFIDYVPAGVVELVESLGVRVVSSADLISRSYAQWGETGRLLHRRASEILARTARAAFERAGAAANDGSSILTEFDLAAWIGEELAREGLTGGDTIVAVGPNSASPHYWPQEADAAELSADRVLLIDLWGRVAGEPDAVFADQTWMGFLGPELPSEVAEAWAAVRAARDGAVDLIRGSDPLPTGAEVDRRVREILASHGYGEAILHRTGHAMDRVNHGFGPNLDSVETRDDRRLVTGIGFSVEPGLYFGGRFGLRSEINVHMTPAGPEVTPPDMQNAPWLLDG